MYNFIKKNGTKVNTVPQLPLLMVMMEDNIVESDSITGLVTALVGDEYLDLNDEEKCLKRIKLARREAMYMLQFDVIAVITDGKSLIKNNYAVDPDDEDYEYDENEVANAQEIKVRDEKDFLLSLARLGVIRIFEKVGSKILLAENTNQKNINPGDIANENQYIEVI